MQFVVMERIRRYGSCALAGYVSVARSITSTAAAGIAWLIALVGVVPSGYRTEWCSADRYR